MFGSFNKMYSGEAFAVVDGSLYSTKISTYTKITSSCINHNPDDTYV